MLMECEKYILNNIDFDEVIKKVSEESNLLKNVLF